MLYPLLRETAVSPLEFFSMPQHLEARLDRFTLSFLFHETGRSCLVFYMLLDFKRERSSMRSPRTSKQPSSVSSFSRVICLEITHRSSISQAGFRCSATAIRLVSGCLSRLAVLLHPEFQNLQHCLPDLISPILRNVAIWSPISDSALLGMLQPSGPSFRSRGRDCSHLWISTPAFS